MKIATSSGLGVALTLTASAIGAAAFIGSGVYDIGADDHHTKPVLAIIETLRERSIDVRAADITVPRLEDPADIAAGAAHYETLCVGCPASRRRPTASYRKDTRHRFRLTRQSRRDIE